MRVYIYFNDTVIGDVANVELVDKDGDIVAKADDRVLSHTWESPLKKFPRMQLASLRVQATLYIDFPRHGVIDAGHRGPQFHHGRTGNGQAH